MKKNCKKCGKEMIKTPNYSVKFWKLKKFCSHSCIHRDRIQTDLEKKRRAVSIKKFYTDYPNARQKLSKIRKKQYKNGFNPVLGKHWKLSDDSRKNQSKAQTGEGNGYWKGGNNSQSRRKFAPRPKPNKCEVCGESGRIVLDHNHKTNKFRGWICHNCNVTIGFAKENATRLALLINYLKK